MICSNPVLDQLEEIIRFRDNLFGLCMSCDGGMIVVDHIALSPARFKEIQGPGGRSSKREPGRFKREPVMTRCACELIASARNGHFCRLQRGVVGGGEPTIVRQLLDRRILKIANDERPQLV